MKCKQSILSLVVALSVVTGILGCQKDDTAVKALQELTAQQAETVKEQNTALSNLVEEIATCQGDLAKAKGEVAVIKTKDAAVEVPSLVGEVSVESLDALKAALAETIERQKAQLTELKAAHDGCVGDLATATEAAEEAASAAAAEAEAAAAAAAEEESAAKAAAARRAKKKKKPTAVKEAEAAGEPTKGVRSRY